MYRSALAGDMSKCLKSVEPNMIICAGRQDTCRLWDQKQQHNRVHVQYMLADWQACWVGHYHHPTFKNCLLLYTGMLYCFADLHVQGFIGGFIFPPQKFKINTSRQKHCCCCFPQVLLLGVGSILVLVTIYGFIQELVFRYTKNGNTGIPNYPVYSRHQ